MQDTPVGALGNLVAAAGSHIHKFRYPDLVGNAHGTGKQTKRRSKKGLTTK